MGGLHLKPPKFEHIFVAVVIFFPFLLPDNFDTNLLVIVCDVSIGARLQIPKFDLWLAKPKHLVATW